MKDSLRHQTSPHKRLTAVPLPMNTVEERSVSSGVSSSLLEAEEESAALQSSGVLGRRRTREVEREKEGVEVKSYMR